MIEHQARTVLKNVTPWNDLYFRLSSSDYKDDRWSSKNFGRQKVEDVKKAINFIEKQDLLRYNINSVATAKLGAMVAGALGGKKSRIQPNDFLPFDAKSVKKEGGLTDESMIVLRQLMKTRKMDGRVIALMADDIKAFAGRNEEQ